LTFVKKLIKYQLNSQMLKIKFKHFEKDTIYIIEQ
jgi:hypothetical protein